MRSWTRFNHVLRARYHKMAGQLRMDQGQYLQALAYFNQADGFYPNIAVKGKIKECESALKDDSLAAQQPQPPMSEPVEILEKTG